MKEVLLRIAYLPVQAVGVLVFTVLYLFEALKNGEN